MDCHIVASILIGSDARRHSATRTERGIERAVWVVPDQREIVIGVTMETRSAHNDHAIGLKSKTTSSFVTRADTGRHLATYAETRIQRSIREVTNQRKVVVAPVEAKPSDENHAVGLDHEMVAVFIPRPDSRRHFATCTEGSVKCSVRVVTNECKVVVAPLNVSAEDNLSISLNLDYLPHISTTTDRCGYFTARTKAWVE